MQFKYIFAIIVNVVLLNCVKKKHLRDKKKTYNIISQPKVGNRHRNVEIRGINGHKTKQVEICLECGDELGGIRNKTYHDPFI